MTLSDTILLIIIALILFLLIGGTIYHIKEEREYRKFMKDLERPVDSLLIRKGKL